MQMQYKKGGRGTEEGQKGITCLMLLPGMALITLPLDLFLEAVFLLLLVYNGGCTGGGRRSLGSPSFVEKEKAAWGRGGERAWERLGRYSWPRGSVGDFYLLLFGPIGTDRLIEWVRWLAFIFLEHGGTGAYLLRPAARSH